MRWSFILFALQKHNFAFWCIIGNHHVEAVWNNSGGGGGGVLFVISYSWLLKKFKSLSKFVYVAQKYYIFSWVRQHFLKFKIWW